MSQTLARIIGKVACRLGRHRFTEEFVGLLAFRCIRCGRRIEIAPCEYRPSLEAPAGVPEKAPESPAMPSVKNPLPIRLPATRR